MERPDIVRDRPRPVPVLAWTALALHVVVPLLPFYGTGFQFFWTGIPGHFLLRFVLEFLVTAWTGAVALVFAIVMLRRQRSAVAAGVFVAIAIVVLGGVANQVIPAPVAILREWRADLVLGLRTSEAAILLIAASMALPRSS